MVVAPGRSCPISYHYPPEALVEPAAFRCRTLYVVGGLYGNDVALRAILDRAGDERPAPVIVFNGDFHYFDVDDRAFATVDRLVGAHHAIQGNVEAQLLEADPELGCGCDYPAYINDAVVERSNTIVGRLQTTAGRFPTATEWLASLPRHLTVEVADQRIGIVHGDPESLAGWRLALEAMEPGDSVVRREIGWIGEPTSHDQVVDWMRRANLRVIASTHTGLAYAQDFLIGGCRHLVVNNGSAGLANFHQRTHGVITRISDQPRQPADALYGTSLGPIRCDALPVSFDLDQWLASFVAQWPPGSAAHDGYFHRITSGTTLQPYQAARGTITVYAA
jgi:hypothetical protein